LPPIVAEDLGRGEDVRKLLKALRSVKLAIILIAYLAATGILATLAPQGPAALRGLFANFYGSPLFLVPAFLFFANLAACSADRFVRERRKGALRRHGPDLLHLGLILLILGAVFGQVAKQGRPAWQGFARLAAGEAVALPNGKLLVVRALENQRYADGRPKDWISTVELSQDGRMLIPSYEIRVNHPLRMGALSIYQVSYGSERVLGLKSPSGAKRSLAAGESLAGGQTRLTLMSVDLETGIAVAREEGEQGSRTISLQAGSRVGDFIVEGAKEVELTGLQAVYDPSFPVIILALAMIGLGACITFARKIGDLSA
jgi:cytochrome c biogenesis protein ResB